MFYQLSTNWEMDYSENCSRVFCGILKYKKKVKNDYEHGKNGGRSPELVDHCEFWQSRNLSAASFIGANEIYYQ